MRGINNVKVTKMRSKTNLNLIQSINLGDHRAGYEDEVATECTAVVGMEAEELKSDLYGFVSVYLMKLNFNKEQILN